MKKIFTCLLAFIIFLAQCDEGMTEEKRLYLTGYVATTGALGCSFAMTAEEAQGIRTLNDTEIFLSALGCFVIGGLIGYYATNYPRTESSRKEGLQPPAVMFATGKEDGTNKEYPIIVVNVLQYQY